MTKKLLHQLGFVFDYKGKLDDGGSYELYKLQKNNHLLDYSIEYSTENTPIENCLTLNGVVFNKSLSLSQLENLISIL